MIAFQQAIDGYLERNEKPDYYMCSVDKMKNGTIFIRFPQHFSILEELSRTIYFSVVNNQLF